MLFPWLTIVTQAQATELALRWAYRNAFIYFSFIEETESLRIFFFFSDSI